MASRGAAARSGLTPDEVRSMLLGRPSRVEEPTGTGPGGTVASFVDRPSRCSRCRRVEDGLYTFDVPGAWATDLNNYETIDRAVRMLRRLRGIRSVLLCLACVEALGGHSPETVAARAEECDPVQQHLPI